MAVPIESIKLNKCKIEIERNLNSEQSSPGYILMNGVEINPDMPIA